MHRPIQSPHPNLKPFTHTPKPLIHPAPTRPLEHRLGVTRKQRRGEALGHGVVEGDGLLERGHLHDVQNGREDFFLQRGAGGGDGGDGGLDEEALCGFVWFSLFCWFVDTMDERESA